MEEIEMTQINNGKLEFTGNWFIDAGILGFVNLMEEVYGWDLEELRETIDKEPEKVYYGYFPFAYLYKWLFDRNLKVNPELVKKLKNELEERKFHTTKELFNFVWFTFICDLFKDLWVEKKSQLIYKNEAYSKGNRLKKQFDYKNTQTYLQKIYERETVLIEIKNKHQDEIKNILNKKKEVTKLEYKDLKELIQFNNENISNKLKELIKKLKRKHIDLMNFLKEEWEENVIKGQRFTEEESNFYRLPIDSSFFKNFLFFNNSLGNLKQKESFYNAISFNYKDEKILRKIDKTINKFLHSEDEFPNITYAHLSIDSLKDRFPYLFVYLLCFVYAFENYKNMGNIFFYSNDLEFSYLVNKRLKFNKNKVEKSRDPNIIFKVTWQQIINLMTEYKSSWSLENMYIISFRRLDNQELKDVEYIGIPKLQASIILDNTIRENLNKQIKYRIIKDQDKKYKQYCWLLEEFVKGKPLYPIILNHLHLVLNEKEKVFLEWSPSFYSLIIEANLLKFKEESEVKNKNIFSENYFGKYRLLTNKIKKDIKITSFTASLIRHISEDPDKRKRIARELFNAIKKKNKNMFLNILLKNMNEKKELCANKNLTEWIFDKIINNNESFIMYGLILIMNLLRG
ncbi:MAG: hypothetical protein QXJ20_01220 [Candidatus Aenigmatarchaeota archaeon]